MGVITGEQIRAARALARIDQAGLARLSTVSLETIKRLERIQGPVSANVRTIRAIEDSFQRLGVGFDFGSDGDVGVRLAVTGAQGGRVGRPALHRLVYCSVASETPWGDGHAPPRDLLARARQANASLGVASVLLSSGGRYLQSLEGDRRAVLQAYGAISADTRHRDFRVLQSEPISEHRYADCDLCAEFVEPSDRTFREGLERSGGLDGRLLSTADALALLDLVAQRAGRRISLSA